MYFETFILTILFKNAKLNIKKKKKKSNLSFRSEKGKQTSFFRPYLSVNTCFSKKRPQKYMSGFTMEVYNANKLIHEGTCL